jgi:DNA-binding transcriptional LysR family regulator
VDISIDQASAFHAVVELGTIQKAAESLNKGHSAILYLIRTLESQLGLKLFDRTGYRNKVTLEGEIALKYCREMLRARNDLRAVCKKLHGGWEPSLKLIYDGVVDFSILGNSLFELNEFEAPTEIKVISAFLDEVERKFEFEKADMMVTILPISRQDVHSISLRPFKMLLVAHSDHALGKIKGRSLNHEDLQNQTYIKVGSSIHSIGLSTDHLNFNSYFYVNDFYTKKQAILKKLGFGWLPEYLIQAELKNRKIKILPSEIQNTISFRPKLFHRREEVVGKMAQHLLRSFRRLGD